MIELPWPPTVNTYYTVARGRKIMSKKGRDYKYGATIIAGSQWKGEPLKGDITLFIRAYPPDKRKRDLDNILKPVLDSLTEAGIYVDDSQVADLRIQRFRPSKRGRVEIMVSGT